MRLNYVSTKNINDKLDNGCENNDMGRMSYDDNIGTELDRIAE